MNLDQIKSLGKDDFLNMLGLETRRTNSDYILPALAVFGVGILIGGAAALLFAPRSGRALRDDLSHRLQAAPETLANLPHRAAEAFHRATDATPDNSKPGRDGKNA